MNRFSMLSLITGLFVLQFSAFGAKTPEYQRLYDQWKFPEPVPNFTLQNQDSRWIKLHRYKGKFVFLGFMFTRCAVMEACPLTTQRMKKLQSLWNKKVEENPKLKNKFQLISATFDPKHDRPKVLKSYAARFNADFDNWSFVTGPKKLMESLLPSLFNVIAYPDNKSLYRHNIKAALLGPDLKDLKTWPDNEFKPEKVIELILKTIEKETPTEGAEQV